MLFTFLWRQGRHPILSLNAVARNMLEFHKYLLARNAKLVNVIDFLIFEYFRSWLYWSACLSLSLSLSLSHNSKLQLMSNKYGIWPLNQVGFYPALIYPWSKLPHNLISQLITRSYHFSFLFNHLVLTALFLFEPCCAYLKIVLSFYHQYCNLFF